MNTTMLLPKDRLLALAPADVERYVQAHGWEADARASSQEVGVYHRPGDPVAEILVPRDRGFVDYALRMADVLKELAAAQHRKAWEVLEDLSPRPAGASVNGPAVGKRRTARKKRTDS
jgi:hypothetical protein